MKGGGSMAKTAVTFFLGVVLGALLTLAAPTFGQWFDALRGPLVAQSPASQPTESQPSEVTCGLQLSGYSAQVVATGLPGSCERLVYASLAVIGAWDSFDPATQPPLGPSFLVCTGVSFDLNGGYVSVSVYDTGGQLFGRQACLKLRLPSR